MGKFLQTGAEKPFCVDIPDTFVNKVTHARTVTNEAYSILPSKVRFVLQYTNIEYEGRTKMKLCGVKIASKNSLLRR